VIEQLRLVLDSRDSGSVTFERIAIYPVRYQRGG
jgi:hypothetical protein